MAVSLDAQRPMTRNPAQPFYELLCIAIAIYVRTPNRMIPSGIQRNGPIKGLGSLVLTNLAAAYNNSLLSVAEQ